MKKALRETWTLCMQYGRAKIFRPAADPLSGGWGRPKVNQLEMDTTFTYRPSLVKIDAHNLVIVVTDPHTHTDRTDCDYNILRR